MLYCIHLFLSHTLPTPPLPPLHSALHHYTPLLSLPLHSIPLYSTQSQLLLTPTVLYTLILYSILFLSILLFLTQPHSSLIHNILFSSPLSFTLFFSLTLFHPPFLHQPTKRTTINAMQCYLNGGDYRSVMSVFEQIPKVS